MVHNDQVIHLKNCVVIVFAGQDDYRVSRVYFAFWLESMKKYAAI